MGVKVGVGVGVRVGVEMGVVAVVDTANKDKNIAQ